MTNITYLPFALCAIAYFAVSPTVRAVCQEGCDLNGGWTTVLGDEALVNNLGVNNTAIGEVALHNNISGSDNTAIGEQALQVNDDGNNNTAIGVHGVFTTRPVTTTRLSALMRWLPTQGRQQHGHRR